LILLCPSDIEIKFHKQFLSNKHTKPVAMSTWIKIEKGKVMHNNGTDYQSLSQATGDGGSSCACATCDLKIIIL